VVAKSPGVAVLASLFIPGLGSMISGNPGIGVLILVLYVMSWPLVLVFIGIVGVIGFWIWGMVQAYHDAVTWNTRHGLVS
jgi:TM2 domain-containing membrane protein YozV